MDEIDVVVDAALDAADYFDAAMFDEAAAVEDDAAVQQAAAAPDIAALPGEDAAAAVDRVAATSTWATSCKEFAVWSVKAGAGALVAFGIMYGLNKAMASKSASTGTQTALSDYLTGLEANFLKLGLEWDAARKQKAADDALAFPWIDATK